MIEDSNKNLKRGYDAGVAKCLSPQSVKIGEYWDSDRSEASLIFRFEFCAKLAVASTEDCMNDEAASQFLNDNPVIISWYDLRGMTDFKAKHDFHIKQMNYLGEFDTLSDLAKQGIKRETVLRIQQTEMIDNVFDPFNTPTFEHEILQVQRSQSTESTGKYEHIYRLDNVKQVNKRVRYTWWNAIADIGGFSDGLALLVGPFLSWLADKLFQVSLTKDSLEEPKLSSKDKKERRNLTNILKS